MNSDALDKKVLEVLHSGWVGQGARVANFEAALANKLRNPRVLCLSAGTHGLTLALRLAGVGPGDEVITTPLTCTATNMPILQQGADIVWADVGQDFNISPLSVESSLTDRTRAIIVVHWGGYPCEMNEIAKIAHDAGGIPVIEDCAHAYGSTYRNWVIGECEHSAFAIFSFQAIKHLTTVDGGALCCRLDDDYDRGKLLRWYGIDRETPRQDMRCEEDIREWGYKFHMNDVCAIIGLCNMEDADLNISKAISNARYYEDNLLKVDGISLTQLGSGRQSSYWLFTVLVEERPSFVRMMTTRGIAVSRVHQRNDKHACFGQYRRDLPGLESIIDRMVCIPVGWWVSEEDREYIVGCIKEGW